LTEVARGEEIARIGVAVAERWREMVPEPAVLVIGDDDRRVVPVATLLDRARTSRFLSVTLGGCGVLTV
jgi:hypothetical protein